MRCYVTVSGVYGEYYDGLDVGLSVLGVGSVNVAPDGRGSGWVGAAGEAGGPWNR